MSVDILIVVLSKIRKLRTVRILNKDVLEFVLNSTIIVLVLNSTIIVLVLNSTIIVLVLNSTIIVLVLNSSIIVLVNCININGRYRIINWCYYSCPLVLNLYICNRIVHYI